jgi:zinc transport system ATP-binding protein
MVGRCRVAAMSEQPVIVFENVTFAFAQAPVLEDVNLAIEGGDFVWIVGPNGGGKTTLLKLILGLLHPDQGRIKIFGMRPRQARTRIGYMPQSAQVDSRFPVSVMDVVLMGRLGNGRTFGPYSGADKDAAAKALSDVGLYELRNRHFAALSGGQQRRLLVARALACAPDILLLDEPMANLDLIVEKEILGLLHRLSAELTVIMASHDPALVAQDVKSVVCVNRKVAIHPTHEIDGEMMGDLYRGKMRMVRHDKIADGD